MIRSLNDLHGYALHARDGDLGHVADVLIDDRTWRVRYLVADTGGWLGGRQVLLDPAAVEMIDDDGRRVAVTLTRDQVEGSPPVEADAPVSQQMQVDVNAYYGWPAYWGADGVFAPGAQPLDPSVEGAPPAGAFPPAGEGDPHLRSVRELSGYHVRAADDEIGHVEDLLADDGDWVARYAVIDTRNWLPGRKVLVGADWLEAVSWADRAVDVSLRRAEIEQGPDYAPGAPIDRDYEERLHRAHGRVGYWSASE